MTKTKPGRGYDGRLRIARPFRTSIKHDSVGRRVVQTGAYHTVDYSWKYVLLACGAGGVYQATWPSQRSMSWAFSLLALMSLLCSSLPSKYIHGQQCSQGMGCPHASLANMAMSTPFMNRAASSTPRGSRLSICRRKNNPKTFILCPNEKKRVWSSNSPRPEHSD